MKEVLPKLAGSLKLSAHNWWGKIRKSQKQGLYRALPREDRYLAQNGLVITGIMDHVKALFALLHIGYKSIFLTQV